MGLLHAGQPIIAGHPDLLAELPGAIHSATRGESERGRPPRVPRRDLRLSGGLRENSHEPIIQSKLVNTQAARKDDGITRRN